MKVVLSYLRFTACFLFIAAPAYSVVASICAPCWLKLTTQAFPELTSSVIFAAQDGADWKELDSPRGLTFHPDGKLYITDFNNHRIVALDPETGKMTYLCREGTEPGRLLRPQVSDSQDFDTYTSVP